MSSVIEPALIGIASALLTLLLTPRIQHYFWGYQRMSELRLEVYKELTHWLPSFLQTMAVISTIARQMSFSRH
jgi:hypothetical protein